MVERDSSETKWSRGFFLPLGQLEGWFHGWLWEKWRNRCTEDPLTFYGYKFPSILYSKLLLQLKKRNWRDSCIDSIFKSLVAGIIKVPIRLYWSLTFKDTLLKRGCYVVCSADTFDVFTKRYLFNVKRKEQWLSVLPSVWECAGIFYCWVGIEVCCEMIFMNAIS